MEELHSAQSSDESEQESTPQPPTAPAVAQASTRQLWVQVGLILALTQPFHSPSAMFLTWALFPHLPETFAGEWLYRTFDECARRDCAWHDVVEW